MTRAHRITLALIVAACFILAGMIVAAWPATGQLGPVVTPPVYNAPSPSGGQR